MKTDPKLPKWRELVPSPIGQRRIAVTVPGFSPTRGFLRRALGAALVPRWVERVARHEALSSTWYWEDDGTRATAAVENAQVAKKPTKRAERYAADMPTSPMRPPKPEPPRPRPTPRTPPPERAIAETTRLGLVLVLFLAASCISLESNSAAMDSNSGSQSNPPEDVTIGSIAVVPEKSVTINPPAETDEDEDEEPDE